MTTLPEKAYYRPDEVAKFFSVSTRTVYLWIEERRLPAVKIAGTVIRIARESLTGIKTPIE